MMKWFLIFGLFWGSCCLSSFWFDHGSHCWLIKHWIHHQNIAFNLLSVEQQMIYLFAAWDKENQQFYISILCSNLTVASFWDFGRLPFIWHRKLHFKSIRKWKQNVATRIILIMVKGTHHVQVKDEAHFTHKSFPSFPIAAKLLLPPCLDCNSKAYEMGFEPWTQDVMMLPCYRDLDTILCRTQIRDQCSGVSWIGICSGATDVKGSYPVYNAKLGALNPTSCRNVCGISTRPEDLVQAESDNLRSFVAEKRPVLSVGRTVHLIMLQLLVLLTDHQYHRITFPILRELLPLLQPPADHEGCLSEKVRVR